MKKIKSIKKLINLTLIGGSILTTLPLIISSCSSGNNIDTTYYGNIDGSN
jgi:hypothetical protein